MSLIGKFASVGGATMASRVLGFVREAMIAAFLGAGPVADAFYAAFRFPNLFRRLFAEGAFNAAFVPLFAKEIEGGGPAGGQKFAEQVLAVLVFRFLTLSALAMIFMPFLVGTVIAPKFASDPAKFDLTVLLARIMFPYLAAMSLVAMLAGILNSLRRYFLAALAPVLLNIVLVSGLIGVRSYFDLAAPDIGKLFWAGRSPCRACLQLGLLVWALWREGFSARVRAPAADPGGPAASVAGAARRGHRRHHPDQSAGRADHRVRPGRRDRRHQLCRPAQPVAARCDRHRHRCRAAARIVPCAQGRRRQGSAASAKPQPRIRHWRSPFPPPSVWRLLPEPIIALVFERGAFTAKPRS
jgi:putative peptidoglycan lipid II flippase